MNLKTSKSELDEQPPVWILEDDPAIAEIYSEILEVRCKLSHFDHLESLRVALKDPLRVKPELLIADLRLPDGNFLKFLSEDPDASLIECPFLLVSSLDDLDFMRLAFDEGAADYLVKPFTKSELIVKVERTLEGGTIGSPRRKINPNSSALKEMEFREYSIHDDRLSFDPGSLCLKRSSGSTVQLTSKEVQLFFALQENAKKGTSRQSLQNAVWRGVTVSAKTLDVHLFNLRRKIKPLSLEIVFAQPDLYYLLRHGVDSITGGETRR